MCEALEEAKGTSPARWCDGDLQTKAKEGWVPSLTMDTRFHAQLEFGV